MIERSIGSLSSALAVVVFLAAVPSSIEARQHAGHAVVEVGAEDYAFRAPSEIPSGWNTLRFTNEGEEHHFMLMVRLPDGYTFDDYMIEVMVPFDDIWRLMRDGDVDTEEGLAMLETELPEWYYGAEFMGGPGLVAPGNTTEVALNLPPGNYVIECYMKTPEGEFHAVEGMTDPITVTEAASGGAPPVADIRVTLANYAIEMEGELSAGRQVIEVHYADQPEEPVPGHDLQLVRLTGDAGVEEIVAWMNWIDVPGLMHPAPAPFIGGINQMPVGSTAYLTVDLEPGRYLFVSEYTGAMGVRKEFTVER